MDQQRGTNVSKISAFVILAAVVLFVLFMGNQIIKIYYPQIYSKYSENDFANLKIGDQIIDQVGKPWDVIKPFTRDTTYDFGGDIHVYKKFQSQIVLRKLK